MLKAALFDLDGLLVDTEVVSLKIYQALLAEVGVSFTKAEYAKHYSGKTEVANIRRLLDTYQLAMSEQACLDKVLALEQKLIAQGVELKPWAQPLLAYLKQHHFKVALATSSTKERALALLSQHKVLAYFDEFVFSEDVKQGKPNPEVFLKACEKLGVTTKEAVVFEDSENGIMAAVNANLPVICIPDMKKPAAEYLAETAAVYENLADAIAYFKN